MLDQPASRAAVDAVGRLEVSRQEAAGALQRVLWEELGLPAPRLLALVGALLGRHAAWFRLQRCEDPFTALLGLRGLRLDGAAGEAEGEAEAGAPPEGFRTEGEEEEEEDLDGMDEDEPSPEAMHHPEESILTVMEFLSVTRVDAIYLLSEHGGDIEATLATVLG